ncbi:hypothetical protein JKP88DRAFT_243194 [Tribonema minus]|uniref:Uncharacterized protein n=1 Tax=Tribonema minus TaxID=303371 RepID=A0A835ZCJ9_9STRA|nr:hypothetical protein JKP88DRAFT_243194 [Tribonema minus]
MLRAHDMPASVRPRGDDVQSWRNFGMLSNVSKNLRPPMTTSRTDAVEATLPCLSSTRGAVELDGSGASEQPRWTAATAAAHQPDALAKELRDFNQVYGSFVSEHPHPTDVPDYLLVPPASVTSGCMVSTWEPRDELDCCASFTDDDEVLCMAYERVVWTVAGVHPDSGRVTLVCGGGAGPDGEVRPNKDFEAADWKETWVIGEVSPWAPQVGEVVLYYSSSYADKKAMPSIAQITGHAQPVSHPFSKVTDMGRLRDIRGGYGGVLVRPIINGKKQPTVMLAWHKLQPLGRSVSSFCTLPPDRALMDSYVMAPTDVEEWARPLVYASSPSLLDCAYTCNTSSPLRAWLSSDGHRVSSYRPKNGLQGLQMQPSMLQRSSYAGYAPAVAGGETRSQCSGVGDGAAGKSLRVPVCSAVQVCSGPGDSSAHGRLRADGDHAHAITGGALLTAVARQGSSANRSKTPTTRHRDIASTIIGGDADSGAQASTLSIGGDGAQLHVDGGGRVGDARRTSAPTTTAPAAAETRVLAGTQAPACVPATVQAGAAAAQADAMEAVAEHGVGRMESAGGEISSGTQSAAERLHATARSAATGDGLFIAVSASTSVSGSDADELQSLSHVAIGEGIILAGLPAISKVGVSAPPLVKGVDGSAQGSGTTSSPTTLCEPALGAPQQHMPQAEVMSTAAQAGVTATQAGANGAVAERRSQGEDTVFPEVALQSAVPQGKDTEFAVVAHQSGTLSPALVSLSRPAETSASTADTGSAHGILSAGALALLPAKRTSDAGTGLQSRSHATVEGDSTLGIIMPARLEFDVGGSARGSATLTACRHGSTSPSSARAGVCNSGAPGQLQTTGVLVGCSPRLNIAMATAGPNGFAPDAAVLPEDRDSSAQWSAGVAGAACEISSMSRSPWQDMDGSVLQQLSESLINSLLAVLVAHLRRRRVVECSAHSAAARSSFQHNSAINSAAGRTWQQYSGPSCIGCADGPPCSERSSALSCATDGGGAPGSTQCSDMADGHEGSAPGITPLTVCKHGGHAQSSKLRAGSCSRAVGPGSISLDNGVDDSAQSLLRCANMIGGRRDATHSTAALSGGQGHDDTQVLAVAVGAAGELGVHRRKVGPFTGTDESSTVPTQGLAQTASIADGDRMARSSKQLPGHTCSARSSAATVGANIQSSVPRTERISNSAHGFAQHADAGGGDGDGVRGFALPPAGDTGTENLKQLAGDGGGHDAISTSRSPTVPSAGSSITDSTARSAVSSGGRHDTAHGSAPLCDEHSRVIQVCTCAAVDGVAIRCDCHTQTLSSEPPIKSAGSNAQGLAKSAGASGNHGDGTCSSGPLSTQGFAQSAVDGSDGGVGTHGSVPLSVLLDGGTHDSGVISTAHGFALTSAVTGAEQRSSFYSAQSLISQSGTASNGTANATTLSLVGGHAGNLQSSHAAQVVAGHDGTRLPMRMGSGPTRGVEQSQMGGVGGGDIGSDDTAASAGTGNGDLLLQQRVRTALQYQRPQLSNEAAGTTYAIGYHSGHLLRQQQWLVAAGHSGGDTAACVSDSGGASRTALDISQTAQLGLRTGKLLPHQAHKALQVRRSALPHQQQASAMQQLRSTPVQRLSPAQHNHQRQLLLAAPQPQQCSVLAGGICFHQALCPKVQWTGSPTPTHMAAGPTTEEATLVPTSGIDDASVPFDPGICSKAYATVPAGMGVSTQSPAATRINDSLSSNARLNGEVQRLLLPLTVQRCTECRTVALLSSTSNTGTGVASCQSSERSASFGRVGGICGVLAPLTAAPNSHDPFTADSNMVLATAPGVVYSSAGGAAVSVSTSNGQRSIAESSSTVECNMEAVQLVAVATTAGACRLAEAVRRKAMVLVQQGTARAGITTSAQCAALVPAQHSPMAGRTAMTTRSINPGEEAARNNGSYTGHISGEGEAHTVGSSVAICNSGGKAYSYAVLRGDEVRTHDVVVLRGGENDVQPMAHTADVRQEAHGDVVARGFEDKEPNATGEVCGSSEVQAVPWKQSDLLLGAIVAHLKGGVMRLSSLRRKELHRILGETQRKRNAPRSLVYPRECIRERFVKGAIWHSKLGRNDRYGVAACTGQPVSGLVLQAWSTAVWMEPWRLRDKLTEAGPDTSPTDQMAPPSKHSLNYNHQTSHTRAIRSAEEEARSTLAQRMAGHIAAYDRVVWRIGRMQEELNTRTSEHDAALLVRDDETQALEAFWQEFEELQLRWVCAAELAATYAINLKALPCACTRRICT